ncbi:MAG: hypothetical protein GY770_07100 [Aestuariibacter sp.]|nr:hypothetical protein [Aestuariibacter sp.]
MINNQNRTTTEARSKKRNLKYQKTETKMKQNRLAATLKTTAILAVLCLLSVVTPAQAQESVCAEVKIEIRQELTLERQAFEGFMKINNKTCHSGQRFLLIQNPAFTDQALHGGFWFAAR